MTRCESPIEQMLYNAMIDCGLLPTCQYVIGPYRVDFALLEYRLIVEADGKYWHKGWRKRRDYRRDKWLRSQAWDVIRFTGREIYADAHACARKVKARTRR